MNRTDVAGMSSLQIFMEFLPLLVKESFSVQLLIFEATGIVEFATFDPVLKVLTFLPLLFNSSFVTNTTKTNIGIRSPCKSQTSISFRVESSGIFSKIELYRVYITRLDVRATMIMASKWVSSMKRIISAAKTRQIDGINNDIQNGPESLFSSKAK